VSDLIDPQAKVSDFFTEAVRGAAESRGYDPDAPSAVYVAGLLADFAKADPTHVEALDRPLTLLLHDALEAAGPERFHRLRGLGDATLYLSGFFADHLERRGVEPRFVGSVGRASYDAAAAMLRRAAGENKGPDLFGELSSNFHELVLLLRDVADTVYALSARDPRGVLTVYERWTKSGSHALAGALARWGVVPARGSSGSGLLH
jgi:hypothetical protein